MLPPIPAPPPILPLEKGSRPPLLKLFITISVIEPWIGSAIFAEDKNRPSWFFIAFISFQIMFCLLHYALWIGKNWARITLIVLNAIALIPTYSLLTLTLIQQMWSLATILIAAVMVWWLRSPAIVTFTKGRLA